MSIYLEVWDGGKFGGYAVQFHLLLISLFHSILFFIFAAILLGLGAQIN